MLPSYRTVLSTALTGLLVLTVTGSAFAKPSARSPKIDRAVRAAMDAGAATQRVIITVKPGYRDTLRQALTNHGDVVKGDHPLIDAVSVNLHVADVEELANQPWVEAVSADARVTATATATVTPTALLTQPAQTLTGTLRETLGLSRIATSGSMTGATGVSVAVIDSGIAPSDDFSGRITGFYDFTRGGIATTPFDDYGHGTHVAGLIGSSGKLSNYEFQGVAPDVRLVGLKVLDGTGQGFTSDVINAIEYVVANKSKLNVQIVNLSLGHPIYAPARYDPLVQAVERASASGLIVVASAGNFGQKQKTNQPGYTGVTSPGNAPSAITVGATMTQDTVTRVDDVVAPYSSRGPTWLDAFVKPDVVAPGHKLSSDTNLSSYLFALVQGGRVKAKNGQQFLQLSGSSMAAAVTSGVVALVVQQHNQSGFHQQKAITANLVKGILEFSAIPVAGADRLTQGAGEINAAGAIALAAAINTGAPAGKWWLGAGVLPSSVIGGTSYPWGQNITWHGQVVGGNLLYVSNIVWSTNIVWGAAASGDNVVWGANSYVQASNIIWGAAQVWAANIVWGDRVLGLMDGDNVVWGTANGDNVVWGTASGDNVVWGTWNGDNIVWGMWDGDNVVWGTSDGDNVVWGTANGDNVVWGTAAGDNIVWGARAGTVIWGTSIGPDGVF